MTGHASEGTPTLGLSWGPWAFQLRGDEIAAISYAGLPVLRGIRAVVRNHNWLTLAPEVAAVEVRETDEALAVELEVAWSGFGARYSGRAEVRIDDDGVAVAFHGIAVEEFLGNRVGLVVLHRPDDAGRPVVVGHPNGSQTEAPFPREISPHQPFKGIAGMSWDRDGTTFELAFSGDVFETEDQRNWTDASFKTYSTPLSRPFPVRYGAGSRVEQSVRLRAVQTVDVGDAVVGRVPEIGFCLEDPASAVLETLPGPLVLDVSLAPQPGDGTVAPSEALKASEHAVHGIDLRIVARTAAEATAILDAILDEIPAEKVLRLTVFDPVTHLANAEVLEVFADHARRLGYRGKILTGARSHFTELNRNPHVLSGGYDGTVYSVTSQMHAVEPESVMETVAMQPLTAAQAFRLGGGRPLHIGPITIAPRFNAVATDAPRDDELPQPSPLAARPLGAAWALGSVAVLTLPEVASLSYGLPGGAEAPMARLLTQLAGLSGSEVLSTATTATGPVAYPVRSGPAITCFLANPNPWPIEVRLTGPDGQTCETWIPGWDTTVLTI
ncbi:hypothetical protein [Sinomonas terrae]|uniref:Uncharacterized protein n=1 Tax=Sinomonas terrae TaxID=2908838 RepID=A0ABS9U7A9_9MICC|nr:hypothetical protein [Sinomonas terrae]MCH6472135.1 hypothetical protein [Sinomonas terrae]